MLRRLLSKLLASDSTTEHHLVEIRRTLAIMSSQIADFAAKVNAHFDQVDAGIVGITADLDNLKNLIARLQGSPGPISADDQATLDAIERRTGALADKVAALDELTPPETPAPKEVVPATPPDVAGTPEPMPGENPLTDADFPNGVPTVPEPSNLNGDPNPEKPGSSPSGEVTP